VCDAGDRCPASKLCRRSYLLISVPFGGAAAHLDFETRNRAKKREMGTLFAVQRVGAGN
jgi:hypothetical protein